MTAQALVTGRYGFSIAAVCLIACNLILSSDLSLEIRHAPHDDSLYVERALRLLSGEEFGPYDSRTLVKYPGMSLWLAGMRLLSIPFLSSVNGLYIASGLYLALAFLKAGVNRWIVLFALALYLFNPITFSSDWVRVMREPLDTGLLVVMFGAIAHIFLRIDERRLPWVHLGIFSVAFAFSMLLREENRLLWLVLGLFFCYVAWYAWRTVGFTARMLTFVVAVLVVPTTFTKAYEYSLRAYIKDHYGLPILHDFAEGEFPLLVAAIRSIESVKDNRLVMVTQERLKKLHSEVPAFAPVVERFPEPGKATFSCRLVGVCSEWSNGWMHFWIKDEAFSAGLTPTLPAAQDYFRRVRTDIENACATGRLRCTANGDGFLPPMELRWTRAYVAEGYRLARMTLAPELYPKAQLPAVELPEQTRQMYQAMGLLRSDMNRSSLLAEIRAALVAPHQILAALLLIAALAALALRLWIADQAQLGPVALVGLIVGVYGLFRLAMLTYVAVFFGPYTSRFVFSTYAVWVLVALPFIAETISAWRKTKAISAA